MAQSASRRFDLSFDAVCCAVQSHSCDVKSAANESHIAGMLSAAAAVIYSHRGTCCTGQQMAQLKWADSLNGLVDLGSRLHSMSAMTSVPHIIRCAPHTIAPLGPPLCLKRYNFLGSYRRLPHAVTMRPERVCCMVPAGCRWTCQRPTGCSSCRCCSRLLTWATSATPSRCTRCPFLPGKFPWDDKLLQLRALLAEQRQCLNRPYKTVLRQCAWSSSYTQGGRC